MEILFFGLWNKADKAKRLFSRYGRKGKNNKKLNIFLRTLQASA